MKPSSKRIAWALTVMTLHAQLWLPNLAWGTTFAPIPLPPPAPAAPPEPTTPPTPKDTTPRFFVREYRVEGGDHLLTREETEEAVYPFLGPYRTAADVEQARAALEKAFRDKGYQTVSVSVPAQHANTGIIYLEVGSGEIGRLRVTGSRYFSIDEIRREAPSLQEGTSPNFTQVTHDLAVLNELSDRQVTPVLRPGEVPGTVDIDLNVKDTPPLHGSVELNNRYSAGTSALRVNGSASYDNLWQLGHSLGFSFQISPEDLNQVKVFSGYYLARIPDVPWLTLTVQGTDQDSNVNTLGGIGVAGKGGTIGWRAVFSLPQKGNYYHSLSLGIDWKHFDQIIDLTGTSTDTPVTYYPLSAAYSGSWLGKGYETDLNLSLNLNLRGMGSSEVTFDENRFGASSSYIYVRGDLSHTRDLPEGFQLFVKGQGQACETPLVNSEQFSGGGLGTVRGYLESEDLGDSGIIGTAELRTPSLGEFLGKPVDDWRFYIFSDGGVLAINDPLPEQQAKFTLASVGAGTRIKLQHHYNGSLDFALPLDDSTDTTAYSPRLTFRVWAEF